MSKNKLTTREIKLATCILSLIYTNDEFVLGWPHFCKCIDFSHSSLDAKAIRFFNEVPSNINAALKNLAKLKVKLQKELKIS